MHFCRTQLAPLRALGMSLADIAAFMHEVKLEMGMNQGKDYHGIEKLRDLALKMESLPQQDKASEVFSKSFSARNLRAPGIGSKGRTARGID
ncbi:hypothetical protein BDZ94DRAFT_1245127 [Collybia nuda]|uniref:Uncharacterized protein n=1 Tax=Collybia nuda TaxID=64659 RepID=A0A9P6CJY7_9AGAR|nr:hypothetical protein BDZ94DRAFT_1245127 [Collybia nuda]